MCGQRAPKAAILQAGGSPIYEPGIEELDGKRPLSPAQLLGRNGRENDDTVSFLVGQSLNQPAPLVQRAPQLKPDRSSLLVLDAARNRLRREVVSSSSFVSGSSRLTPAQTDILFAQLANEFDEAD